MVENSMVMPMGVNTDRTRRRQVVFYGRVSSEHEAQLSALENQLQWYDDIAARHKNWNVLRKYVDEGITGTQAKKRPSFLQMIQDAKQKKFDLIVTREVCRFARNTVDTLVVTRELKNYGVEVYFVEDNIWTMDGDGELRLTIMATLAQEESRSISENVTWGHRKRFADGKVSFAYSRFLGLDKDKETGKIVVVPEQAETVKLIFKLFLEGMTPHSIAAELTERGIKTPSGKDVWNQQTVRRMLSNEKYKGDALLQKEFTVDFLQKKMKKNEGEVPQYYVEGNHEAIISPAVFDTVQAEFVKRKRGGTRYSGVSIFSNKIKCGDCGGWYGAKVWHSTDQYRKVIYRCNHKYKNEKCQTPHVTEEEVKELFIKAYNELLSEKKEIIENAEIIRKTLCKTESMIEEKQRLEDEILVLVEMTQNLVAENARVAQDQNEYQNRYDGLVQRYETAKKSYDDLVAKIEQKEAHGERIKQFIKNLKEQQCVLAEFDDALWGSMVEYVTIGKENRSVTFKDGTEITVE